ncbi:MAG: HAD family hydrolase [Christensenellales bacterium]
MIKTILFDLDGTLLPMNEDEFTKGYFGLLCKRLAPLGYDKDTLIKAIWAGTKQMVKNDGSKTNEQVFWDCFAEIYGKDKLKDKAEFDNFYLSDFKKSQAFCGENKYAKEIVEIARNKGLKTILASNPVFPKDGMVARLGFVGLTEKDFDYISGYEISHYSKPNPKFYQEILDNNNLKADEVIMFGNSESEDYEPATACGIKCYLVGDCVSLKNENSTLNILTFEQVVEMIKSITNKLV